VLSGLRRAVNEGVVNEGVVCGGECCDEGVEGMEERVKEVAGEWAVGDEHGVYLEKNPAPNTS
jgi:hypothetical protein